MCQAILSQCTTYRKYVEHICHTERFLLRVTYSSSGHLSYFYDAIRSSGRKSFVFFYSLPFIGKIYDFKLYFYVCEPIRTVNKSFENGEWLRHCSRIATEQKYSYSQNFVFFLYLFAFFMLLLKIKKCKCWNCEEKTSWKWQTKRYEIEKHMFVFSFEQA